MLGKRTELVSACVSWVKFEKKTDDNDGYNNRFIKIHFNILFFNQTDRYRQPMMRERERAREQRNGKKCRWF